MSDDLVQRLRGFEVDHDPDGWPAIRMRDISACLDEIERLRAEVAGLREQHGRDSAELRRLCAERDEFRQQRDDLIADLAKSQRERDAAFLMSRCECESNECCANLVKHLRRAESAESERDALRMQYDALKGCLHEEIAANLAFRELGGALPDEDMPTFCARLVAERDALRERIEKYEPTR